MCGAVDQLPQANSRHSMRSLAADSIIASKLRSGRLSVSIPIFMRHASLSPDAIIGKHYFSYKSQTENLFLDMFCVILVSEPLFLLRAQKYSRCQSFSNAVAGRS